VADDCELSTYTEIVEVVVNLRFLVRERRRRERLSLRALGRMTGLSASTIVRFEQGNDISTEGLLTLVRWVGDLNTEETDA
jgi:transcriptional regulator with XRE-family HTH domain